MERRKLILRRDTRLESEGAEFLVLGQLLIRKIAAYKAYTRMPGYDVVAFDPLSGATCRISVKSRWTHTATAFPIKNFDCDFVVVVKLNADSKKGKAPEFFIFRAIDVKRAPRGSDGWSKVSMKKIYGFDESQDNWELILQHLKSKKA